ncbi:MAG TPA: hypothetical protein VF677_05745 [Flavobacterium sp.]|jgi:arsenate reductase-like glutaredoxin family protein
MKLTINDFDGYSEDCTTIKKIKSWIEEKGGTFDMAEMLLVFDKAHYNLKSEIVRYINSEHLQKYLEEFILGENQSNKFWKDILESKEIIDFKAKEFGSMLNAEQLIDRKKQLEAFYKSKLYWLEKEIEKYKDFKDFNELLQQNVELKNGYNYKDGTVLQVLNYFFNQSFQPQSYAITNTVMRSVLYNLCMVAKFDENDFLELMKNFNFSYWGAGSIESFYTTMINSGNNSAWKSFEKALDRYPFIIKNKRMHEGIKFKVAEDNKWVYYRCTGWNEDKKIKFVVENEKKQKRFSFDNKEFKAFFKDKKVIEL